MVSSEKLKVLMVASFALILGFILSQMNMTKHKDGIAVVAIHNSSKVTVDIEVAGCGYIGSDKNIGVNDVAIFAHLLTCGDDHYAITVREHGGSPRQYQEGYVTTGMNEYILFLEFDGTNLIVDRDRTRVH